MNVNANSMYDFKELLRKNGLRNTKLKRQIFSFLQSVNGPQDVNQIVCAIPSPHFVSIYRALDGMTKARILKRSSMKSRTVYELSDQFLPHHHHATCEECGRTSQIKSKMLEVELKRIASEQGLELTRHDFELYGVCQDCR